MLTDVSYYIIPKCRSNISIRRARSKIVADIGEIYFAGNKKRAAIATLKFIF